VPYRTRAHITHKSAGVTMIIVRHVQLTRCILMDAEERGFAGVKYLSCQ